MSDTPDLDELARKYLDLWQNHLNTLANDGETIEVLARTMALMNSGAAAFATMAGRPASDDSTRERSATRPDHSEPETACPAPEPANPHLAQCLERITALEGRVAELEGRKRKKPAGGRRTPGKP